MKKFTILAVILLTVFISVSVVEARSYLSRSKIENVVKLLEQYDVDQNKIDQVVEILKKPEPVIIESGYIQPIQTCNGPWYYRCPRA